MCAIIDANVVHEVFGHDRPEAGVEFFKWINSGKGKLVVAGKLKKELSRNANFLSWWEEAQRAGRTKACDDAEVDRQTQNVERSGGYRSDDPHVLALAQISGARLLFTNDQDLQDDFGNSELIEPQGGNIYTTKNYPRKMRTFVKDQMRTFGKVHKNLLRRGDLCP